MADRYGARDKSRSGVVLPIVLGGLLLIVFAGMAWGILSGTLSLSGIGPTTAAVAQASVPTPAESAAGNAAAAAPSADAAPEQATTRDQAFEDWRMTCVAREGGGELCTLMQRLTDSGSGNPVFAWRITQNGEGGLVGVWQTPEGVLLTGGVYLEAGTPQPMRIPYQRCGGGTCVAVATMAPDLVQTVSGAEKITVGYVLTDGRQINFPVSPKGLAAGLAELMK